MYIPSFNHIEYLKILLEDKRTFIPQDILLDISEDDILETLLSSPKIDFNIDDSQILVNMLHIPELVNILLKDGRYDPSIERNRALREACEHKYVDSIEIILKDGRCDPSKCLVEILDITYKQKYLHVLEVILNDSRVDVIKCINHLKPILLDNLNVAKVLVQHKRLDISHCDSYIFALLCRFRMNEHAKKLLFEYKIDIIPHLSEILNQCTIAFNKEIISILLKDDIVFDIISSRNSVNPIIYNPYVNVSSLYIMDEKVINYYRGNIIVHL